MTLPEFWKKRIKEQSLPVNAEFGCDHYYEVNLEKPEPNVYKIKVIVNSPDTGLNGEYLPLLNIRMETVAGQSEPIPTKLTFNYYTFRKHARPGYITLSYASVGHQSDMALLQRNGEMLSSAEQRIMEGLPGKIDLTATAWMYLTQTTPVGELLTVHFVRDHPLIVCPKG